MIFDNKDVLRKIGRDEAFVEGLPGKVEAGEFTMADFPDLAQEVVRRGAAQFGTLHRPNVCPDHPMVQGAFGVPFLDGASGTQLSTKKPKVAALAWFDWNARNGVTQPEHTQDVLARDPERLRAVSRRSPTVPGFGHRPSFGSTRRCRPPGRSTVCS